MASESLLTKPSTLLAIAAVGGVVSGFLGIHGLAFLGWAITLVWLAATIALGLAPGSRTQKALRLAVFGFVTGMSFMCFGYDGDAELVTVLLAFAVIGLFCALCALAVGALVHLVRGAFGRRRAADG